MCSTLKWTGGGAITSAAPSRCCKFFMALSLKTRWVLCLVAVLAPVAGWAQGNYAVEGGEYNVTGVLPGDQVFPRVSIKPTGGYLVWQDNRTDGSGLGVSALKLDSSLSSIFSPFKVNQTDAFDQERPAVTMLNDGGAAFVWDGGRQGFQHVYARFLTPAGTWATPEIMVNTPTNVYQRDASIATLTGGNVVVTWCSFNQVSSNSLRDVYFQMLTPAGAKVGGETRVNQFTTYNQRSAAVAPLSDGRFVVVWISEQQNAAFATAVDFVNGTGPAQIGRASVDVYGRLFDQLGAPVGNEFLINTATNVCAEPSVAAAVDGGFGVAWMEKNLLNVSNSWDIVFRPFSANVMGGTARIVNTRTYGDQLAPKLAAMGTDFLAVWTSMGQDGSREGVFGQFLRGDGTPLYSEFRANSTVLSQQIHPVVASDGVERFLTAWTSYSPGTGSFDLFAQRFVNTNAPLPAPGAPIVTVVSSNALAVSWPPVQGLAATHYEVYADGASTATATTPATFWKATGLSPASTHSYRLAYVVSDGRRSPLSAATTNTTYNALWYYDQIPQEWMTAYFGSQFWTWPNPNVDSDGDGASNRDEFLAGTDPTNAASVLKVRLQHTPQGLYLKWPTQVGLIYQVQSAALPGGTWANVGGLRFASGAEDSVYVSGSSAGFYRVVRLR